VPVPLRHTCFVYPELRMISPSTADGPRCRVLSCSSSQGALLRRPRGLPVAGVRSQWEGGVHGGARADPPRGAGERAGGRARGGPHAALQVSETPYHALRSPGALALPLASWLLSISSGIPLLLFSWLIGLPSSPKTPSGCCPLLVPLVGRETLPALPPDACANHMWLPFPLPFVASRWDGDGAPPGRLRRPGSPPGGQGGVPLPHLYGVACRRGGGGTHIVYVNKTFTAITILNIFPRFFPNLHIKQIFFNYETHLNENFETDIFG